MPQADKGIPSVGSFFFYNFGPLDLAIGLRPSTTAKTILFFLLIIFLLKLECGKKLNVKTKPNLWLVYT